MSDIFKLTADQTILDHDGKIVENGQVHFFDKRSGGYAPVYGDTNLRVSLRQPVQADSAGVLPTIYLEDSIQYRAVITDRNNDRIREIDDVRRHREGIKVLHGITALKHYCGADPFVLVAGEDGCPVFYKRLSGCDLPEENPPEVVRAECGCDCSVAWELCRCEPDICSIDTAELTCDHHVLVQACSQDPIGCGFANQAPCPPKEAPPRVQKASIGALLSAGAKCLPRVCIPHDAPELALVGGGLVYGDRVPPPIEKAQHSGRWASCIQILTIPSKPNSQLHHIRLDGLTDLGGKITLAPEITLTNKGPCVRRYELRALNRLNRARDWGIPFSGVPLVSANFQTRFGVKGDPRLDYIYGVADVDNSILWLQTLSIADSTMGPFLSGYLGSDDADTDPNPGYLNHQSTNGYSENDLVVDLNPGQTATYVIKYHVYWDAFASAQQLAQPERIHFGTRIIARQVH